MRNFRASAASEPRERSEPAKRRARERVGESEGRSPSVKTMRYLIGTSGYNYPEWRGSFYPEKFPTAKMLAFYAERFTTVEVNYTFYRMPTPPLLEGWAKGTPENFTFTLKAPRRITHDSKLRHCAELTQAFCRTAATLGSKLGVLLFQLPPTFKRDDAVFEAFLDLIPEG